MNKIRLLFAILLTIFASTITAAEMPALSLEEIVSLKRVTTVRVSPDGQAIAYLLNVPRELYVDDDGEAFSELHVVDLSGKSRAYITGKVTVKSVAWSTDGAKLFYVAQRDDDEFTTLYEIPFTGGESRKVYAHLNAIGTIFPSPDGRKIAFLATDAPPKRSEDLALKGFRALVYEESVLRSKVWLLDLASGAATAHDLPGSVSDLKWNSDGKRYAIALAPTPLTDDSLIARDIKIVESSNARLVASMGIVGKLGSFAWSPDDSRIAYIAGVDINDPSEGRLFVSSSTGGERRELLPAYEGHVQHIEWNDNTSVRFLGSRGVWSELDSIAISETRTPRDKIVSGPIARAFDNNASSKTIAVIADTPAHPPEVYLLDTNNKPTRLTNSNPLLSERWLGEQQAITYKARDGLELDAILVKPGKRGLRALKPLVVFVHGGPESHYMNGWMSTYSQPTHALAAQGYTVIYPNYRGSTGRGVEFSKLGQHDYAEEEFNDIVDAKDAVIAMGLADKNRVGVSGGSYGGYASMWAASALSEHFAAAVAFVGISNQLSKFGTGDIPREMYNVHSRAWPWEDWNWMLERSPIFHADKTRTPLLIMAGDKDPRVHPSQSLEMYRHVKLRTETPVRLVLYPDEVHGNRKTAAQLDYSMRFERWMNHYLLGAGGEAPPYEIDHATRLETTEANDET